MNMEKKTAFSASDSQTEWFYLDRIHLTLDSGLLREREMVTLSFLSSLCSSLSLIPDSPSDKQGW